MDEYEDLCFRKNNLTERLKDEQNESEIKKFKDRLAKVEADLMRIQNQRNINTRVQEFSSFYKNAEQEQKIKELETKKEAKQKEVNEAEQKLNKSKLERDELKNKIETCVNEITGTKAEIEQIRLEIGQLKHKADENKKDIKGTSKKVSTKALKIREIELNITDKESQIQVK
jgi:chromosome segregation ATPase